MRAVVQEIRRDPMAAMSQSLWTVPAGQLPRQSLMAALSFIVLTLDYALMLVAMTFNTGVFFAVVLGLALGIALFRNVGARHTERLQVPPFLLLARPHRHPCSCPRSARRRANTRMEIALFPRRRR